MIELAVTDTRTSFAQRIASGIGGWIQFQEAQGLGELVSENAIKLVFAQLVSSTGRFTPVFSQKPINWGTTKRRVDVAITGNYDATLWYGSAEVKWLGGAFPADATRDSIIQDVVRTTFVQTQGMNANLLILGGSTKSLRKLFDGAHRNERTETRRQLMSTLLSRKVGQTGELKYSDWSDYFRHLGARVPESVFGGFNGGFRAELVAQSSSIVGQTLEGQVFVWQCNRVRGAARKT